MPAFKNWIKPSLCTNGRQQYLDNFVAEFWELAHGIWQNLPRKTVDPIHQLL